MVKVVTSIIFLLQSIFTGSPTFEEFLRMLTMDALKQNDGLRRLETVLAQEHWNGIKPLISLLKPTLYSFFFFNVFLV